MCSKTPPGCFVEVGVYQGGSASIFYEEAERSGRTLHLFDSFIGIPFESVIDVIPKGRFSDTSIEAVQAAMPNAVIHAGIFPETLTEDVKEIAFVHFEADQYQSCVDTIDNLYPRLVDGGIMAFDDYPFPGIKKAVDEKFGKNVLRTPLGIAYVLKRASQGA